MVYNHFHFAESYWLWGIAIVPLVCLLYAFFYSPNPQIKRLENFIDKHLIPHLLKNSKTSQISVVKSIILGSILWAFLMIAMASPRWDFKEIETPEQDKIMIILLDLSTSMDGDDVKPSRMFRARQEIEDLINLNTDIKIGLIGFAADAHIITPITDDMSNIRYLLPLIGTDLNCVPGTRLTPALKTAKQIFDQINSNNKSILILSDGEFQDQEAVSFIKDLAASGAVVYTIGIGTEEGVTVMDGNGYLKHDGKVVTLKLEKSNLEQLSQAGNGKYFDSDYTDKNTTKLLNQINLRSISLIENSQEFSNNKQWEERFYIFIFPVMLVTFLWFRRGFTFPIILLAILVTTSSALASSISITDKLFLNKDQQAQKALEQIEDYDTAIELFDDPYKRGVAYYKAGNYSEAEKSFKQNQRPEVAANALYNLGNTLLKQNKLEEAISTYQKVLESYPSHAKAKNNMLIAQLMVCKVENKKKDEEKKKKKPKNPGDLLGGGGGGDDDEEEDENGGGKDNKESNDKDKGSDKNEDRSDNNDDQRGGENNSGGGDDYKDKQSDSKESENNQGKDDKDSNQNGDGKENEKNQSSGGAENQQSKGGNTEVKSTGGGEPQQGIDVDQWLNKISGDHKNFLKNQFLIESQKNQTKPTVDPW